MGHSETHIDSKVKRFVKELDMVKPVEPGLSWPAHRGVAGVLLLFGEATHPGKAHPSMDRRESAKSRKGTGEAMKH